ncbi:MAG: hypothetical protein V4569_20730 [Pseudomonadota bacterium]
MTPHRRALLTVICATFATAFGAHAADYPDKPIRLIVPYPPGGTTDLLARAIAPRLGERLHQTVVIESWPRKTEQPAEGGHCS